jgi:hypothetical protein
MTRRRPRARLTAGALGVALAFGPGAAPAQTVSFGAEVGGSARFFPDAPLFGDQVSAHVSPSLILAPEAVLLSESGTWRLVGEGFFRLDAHDENRSHADVRELGIQLYRDSFSAFVGASQVFWGVTEVRHLVDVVNQIDAVEDLDGEDKLGQPMVALTLEGGWGALDLYYLPYFRERTFPASGARLRGPLPVEGPPIYTSGQGRWHPNFAARAFRTFGPLDLGVSVFRGTAREPRFALSEDSPGAPALRPLYDLIDQVGLDAQWTGEATLLKLEALTRGGHGSRLYALSGGLGRTVYQVLGSNGDLGLLSEVMLDSRDAAAPPTIFDRDLFVGGRWALNDVADTSVLGGPLLDLSSGEVLVLLEARRRLGAVWRLEADARLFVRTDPGSLVYGMRNDSHASVSLTRYF